MSELNTGNIQDLINLRSITDLIEAKKWSEIENYFNSSAQLRRLGVTVNLQNPDEPRCDILVIADYHQGGVGQNFIHGGITSALLDLSIGLTALPYLKDGHFATSQLNISFLKPVSSQPVYCIAKMESKINKRVMANATVFNHNGEACVYASGIIRLNV